jgi:nucleoside-diphosphate-sugar epimerase
MNNISAPKVLVTGANGFIGAALTHKLCENGYDVRGIVRFKKRLLNRNRRLEIFTIGEINDDTNWNDALKGIDVVIHLASLVHKPIDVSINSLADYRRVNTMGTQKLAEMSAGAGARRLIFMSTVKVSGERTIGTAFTENHLAQPQGPYAVSKWESEQALHNISDATGLEIVILRSPLVYGQGVKANFLRLLDMVNRNIPLPLSMVSNKRSMIYIGNLLDAIIRCIEHPDAVNKTFLVSDGQDVSTPELIRMIAGAMGKKARLFPCPAPLLKMIGKVAGKSDEIERLTGSLQIDTAKIRRELSWTPPFTMEQGLRMTADWFISNEKNI